MICQRFTEIQIDLEPFQVSSGTKHMKCSSCLNSEISSRSFPHNYDFSLSARCVYFGVEGSTHWQREIKYFRRKEKKLRIIDERFIKTFQTLGGLGNAKGIKIFSRRRIPKERLTFIKRLFYGRVVNVGMHLRCAL
jgi:hypothetical protein